MKLRPVVVKIKTARGAGNFIERWRPASKCPAKIKRCFECGVRRRIIEHPMGKVWCFRVEESK